MSVRICGCAARSLADGPASSAFIAAFAVALLLGTVRRTGTRAGSLTTSPPLRSSQQEVRANDHRGGRRRGRGGAIVGLGVAGVSVGDGVGEGVGAAVGDADGDAVGDGRLAVGVPETAGLGLARRRAAGCDESKDQERGDWRTAEHARSSQEGIHPPSASTVDASPDMCRRSRSQRPTGLTCFGTTLLHWLGAPMGGRRPSRVALRQVLARDPVRRRAVKPGADRAARSTAAS